MGSREPVRIFFDAFLDGLHEIVREEIQAVLSNGASNGKPEATPKAYLTIKEAAEVSRLAPSTIRLLIRRRQLRAFHVGRRVIVKRTDLDKFLEGHPIEALPDQTAPLLTRMDKLSIRRRD